MSDTKLGSQPENEEELQLSTTVTVEESVEFPAVVVVVASKGVSAMTASSSLEKSRRSSTMKWSPPPPPPAALLSIEWRFSVTNCVQNPL